MCGAYACRLKNTHKTVSFSSFFFFFFSSFVDEKVFFSVFVQLRSIAHCTNCSITDKCIFLETRYFSLKNYDDGDERTERTHGRQVQLHAGGASHIIHFVGVVDAAKKTTHIEMKKEKPFFFCLQCFEDEHKCHEEGMHNKSVRVSCVSVCFADRCAASVCPNGND